MQFYSRTSHHVIGPVTKLAQHGATVGGSRRPPNSYAIMRPGGVILVDAPFRWTHQSIRDIVDTKGPITALVLSHNHLLNGDDALEQLASEHNVPIMLHPNDQNAFAARAPATLEDPTAGHGADLLSQADVQVIHIPGHTPGSVMLYLADAGGILLTGDAAVAPGPEQPDQSPRLQRPIGADADPRFIEKWHDVVGQLPLAAVLPLHGAFYLRDALGDAAFDAAVAHIWAGDPMDPRRL